MTKILHDLLCMTQYRCGGGVVLLMSHAIASTMHMTLNSCMTLLIMNTNMNCIKDRLRLPDCAWESDLHGQRMEV